ncbi:MAG: hypothetical protein KC656_37950, partial [Myxococcales bacterium]|nr:hypothetical protein [Myxococcales bacterium]
ALTAAGCDDSAPAETATETAARHAAAGPHAVGYTVLSHARGDAPALAVKAWYPTTAAAADVAYDAVVKLPGFGADPVPFLGHAALDGAPAVEGGPYPLVVLSHGFGMNPEWYHPLAEHLASHGLVVLGPEHSEHDWATDVVAASGARPREVSQTIDLAEAGALGGAIDADRVAVIGHS